MFPLDFLGWFRVEFTSETVPSQTGVSMARKRDGKADDRADRHLPRKMVPVPLAWYEALAELAKANSRPVTWELRLAIADRLKAHKRKVPDE
jgi:hypothetical protein